MKKNYVKKNKSAKAFKQRAGAGNASGTAAASSTNGVSSANGARLFKKRIFHSYDDLRSGLKAVIDSFGLIEKFPKAVLSDALKAAKIDKKDFEGRVDLRDELIFTIDGDDSRDFDDAVSIKKSGSGFELGVHIADVAHYVPLGSNLDKEAMRRGTSVYFPTAVLPMLPKELSNGVCSLCEGEDRLTVSLVMDVDKNGSVVSHSVFESVICSNARLTYKKAAAVLDGDKELTALYLPFKDSLFNMQALAKILTKKRTKRGAVNFDTHESEFEIEHSEVWDLRRAVRLDSHILIEEFMILANETIAERFFKAGAPFVYRTHAPSPPEKLERLQDFLHSVGVVFNAESDTLTPYDYQRLLDSVSDEIRPVVAKMALRSMSKAVYEPKNKGHFGLASEFYCHFTSPIRRYADLTIHRIIKASLKSDGLNKFKSAAGEGARHATEREILAEEAERKFNDFVKAKYMENHIGERFTGIVSGVTEWGVFVELENTAEGLLRLESLDGHYEYDSAAMTLKGKKAFSLGAEVEIIVAGVRGERIEFVEADFED